MYIYTYIYTYIHTHVFLFLIVTSNIALEILAYYYITYIKINFNKLIFVGYHELKLIIKLYNKVIRMNKLHKYMMFI